MKTNDHDAVLDGLRGLAALCVVCFHLAHWLGIKGLASNAGLSVDFFFCLSGYVLTMVYSRRLDADMTPPRFLLVRLIRLMPLIILAAIISVLYAAARLLVSSEGGASDLTALGVSTVLGVLNLPHFSAPVSIGGPQVFPLNGPQYSLFLEIFINIIWGASRHFRTLGFSFFAVIAGLIGVSILGLGGDETGTFWAGFPRVAGAFYLGALAFHFGPFLRDRAARLFPLALVAMAVIFFWPKQLPLPVWIFVIATLTPLLILGGSGIKLSGQIRKAGLLLGSLSFPIYALHYPIFCWINGSVQILTKRQVPWLEVPLVLAAVPLASWIILRVYDEPVRQFLSGRLLHLLPCRAKVRVDRGG